MSKPSKFDLITFQRAVIKNYKSLKIMSEIASSYSENKYGILGDGSELKGSFSGLVKTGFLKILSFFEKNASQGFFEKPDILEYEKKSTEIISNPKISKVLCHFLRNKITDDLLDEEKEIEIIKIVTSTLTKEKFIKEFSIDLDAYLFAFMVYKILQKDVENYCQDTR